MFTSDSTEETPHPTLATQPAPPLGTSSGTLPFNTHSALLAPSLTLSACVRAYVTRSTVGVELPPEHRHNHYPASLYPTLLWRIEGDTEWGRIGDVEMFSKDLPRITFSGPKTMPAETFNAGPVRFFVLTLMPDALHAMTGVNLSPLVNQVRPLHHVLGGDWQAMAQDVLTADSDATRIQLIEDFLRPRWQAVRQTTVSQGQQVHAWLQNLMVRAASAGVGRSARQRERRVKAWAGLSPRELQGFARAEAGYLLGQAERARDGEVSFAELAALTGYADQSHLARITRKVTGLSPSALVKAMGENESYWFYRLF